MDEPLDDEEVLKKMVKKCLKLESELKKVKSKRKVKRKGNVRLKQHISELNKKVAVLGGEETNEQKCCDVIELPDCRVDVETDEKVGCFISISKIKLKNTSIRSKTSEYRCQHPGCKSAFRNKKSLARHQNAHSDKYQCQICQLCCISPANLRFHLHIHTGERPFECDWVGCGKQFKAKGEMNQHIKSKNLNEKPFHCDQKDCGKSFAKKIELQKHLQYHSSLRLFECDVEGCGKSFKTKACLNQHFLHSHSDSKKFRCNENNCGKSFKTKGNLRSHLNLVHSSFRPFQCHGCGKRFKLNNALKQHFKTAHLKERPFKCHKNDCNKSFTTKSLLKQHLIHHSSDLPLQCQVKECGKRFKTNSNLRNHVKYYHPNLLCHVKKTHSDVK